MPGGGAGIPGVGLEYLGEGLEYMGIGEPGKELYLGDGLEMGWSTSERG